MRCLNCGFCCIAYDAWVVDDPDLGLIKTNWTYKKAHEKCKHLKGKGPGEYFCEIHDKEWYDQTPCAKYELTLMGETENTPCRVGERTLKKVRDKTGQVVTEQKRVKLPLWDS